MTILPRPSLRLCSAAALLGAALLACSCSGRKPVFTVRGQVLDAGGKPAAGAVVVFHPVAGGDKEVLKPVGRVDEKGNFTLTTYAEGDGAPAGEYAVTVTWPAPRRTPLDPEGGDRLQGRYANPETSKVRFTVESKPDQEVPTIRLQ